MNNDLSTTDATFGRDLLSIRAFPSRRAMTLVELLTAMAVMGFVMASLAALAKGTRIAADHCDGYGTATQHARVVTERINRKFQEAFANETMPGAIAVAATIGSYEYPDTLVIWHPSGTPGNPTGAPLISELIIYTPNPSSPNELWEVTDTSNLAALDLSSTSATASAISTVLSSTTAKKSVLTNLVRIVSITSSLSPTVTKAAVRFAVSLRPTAAEWTSYKAGTLAWNSLSWPQYLYGDAMGLRQVSIRSEIQINAGDVGGMAGAGTDVIPFPGAAVLMYGLRQ